MPINDPTCLICGFYRDTPNHMLGCVPVQEELKKVVSNNYQFPRIDPDKNYEEYRDDLETDRVLDLEKVKELAAEYEWLRINYEAILRSDLQNEFSKVGTHASWVVEAIREKAEAEKMYEVEELLEILDAGGYMGNTEAETVREYFEFDAWKEKNE